MLMLCRPRVLQVAAQVCSGPAFMTQRREGSQSWCMSSTWQYQRTRSSHSAQTGISFMVSLAQLCMLLESLVLSDGQSCRATGLVRSATTA